MRHHRYFGLFEFCLLFTFIYTAAKAECDQLRLEISPQRLTVISGECVWFHCSSDNSSLQYVWYKDGKLLDINGSDDSSPYVLLPENQLFIPKAVKDKKANFEGSYYCAAKNECGETKSTPALLKIATSREDIVAIKYKYHVEASSAPRIADVRETVIVTTGETLRLDCPVRGIVSRFSWYKGDEVVKPGGRIQIYRNGGLRIFNVSRGNGTDDSGLYQCAAENNFGASRSRLRFVSVKPLSDQDEDADLSNAQDIVQVSVGDRAVMQCPPREKVEPETWWQKSGENISTTADRHIVIDPQWKLTLNKVTYEDAGVYECESSEPIKYNLGNKKKAIQLNVYRKAYFISVPSNITVRAGENATFECRFSGNPMPSFAWHRHDAEMPADPDRFSISEDYSKFTIANVQQSDEGEYACSIHNRMGGVSSSATLSVIVPLKTTITSEEVIAMVNETAVLNCTVEGHPEPLRFWSPQNDSHVYFPGQSSSDGRIQVSEDMQLIIENVRASDAGIYLCSAMNAVDGASAKVTLTIVDSDGKPIGRLEKEKEKITETTGPIIKIVNTQALNSTAVKIFWKLMLKKPHLDSYLVYAITTSDYGFGNVVNITDLANTFCVVNLLRPHSSYEFFIIPYYGASQGTPSNSWTAKTDEAAPSEAPEKVTFRYKNATSVQITWSNPPEDSRNGKLTGFQYKISDAKGGAVKEGALSASTTMLTLSDLPSQLPFYISLAAQTKAGTGPFRKSGPLVVGRYHTMDSCPPRDVIHAEAGQISSPGYPLHFHTNEDMECSYFIATTSDRNMKIIFDEIHLNGSHITVYEGLNKKTREPLGLLTGKAKEDKRTFTTNDSNGITVVFSARNSGIWKAHWSSA